MRHFAALIFALAIVPLCTSTALGQVRIDDFNDNIIDPALWTSRLVGVGPTIAQTNQRLEITFPANSAETGQGVFWSGLDGACQLTGDFDIQVDYELLAWPSSNGVRVGLHTSGVIMRASLGTSADFPGRPWREWYVTDFVGAGLTFVDTSDLAGKLRLTRSGSTLTGYYFSSGNWVAVSSTQVTTADVPFILSAWSHDFAFRDQAVQVAFDNFTVNQGQLVGCPVGTISGQVLADCPAANTSLLGVTVDAFAVGTGQLVGSDTTDPSGSYEMLDLPVGEYDVTLVTPLGYSVGSNIVRVTVSADQTETVDFSLSCLAVVGTARGGGFWKHQVGVATGGKGSAQIDATTLCGYLDIIEGHFNSNSINEVVVYDPPVDADCPQKLLVAKALLNLKGNVGMEARAKQQLLALLLNVASNSLSLRDVASDDGATVSQAITYCDNIIDAASNFELAKDIAEQLNKGLAVSAGVIPLGTGDIAYSSFSPNEPVVSFGLSRIYPNPFNPTTTLAYSIAEAGMVTVRIYDVKGSLVRTLVNEFQTDAEHVVSWEGTDTSGAPAASGIYFVRLESGGKVQTRKIALLK